MKKALFLYVIAIIILLGTILPFKSFAVSDSSIGVSMAPENPSPGETVTITLNSYLNNLDTVLISWFVNGKNISSGNGKKSLTVTAPAAGSVTTVRATIALPSGVIEKNITITPNIMVLLWQATDSYVPPFYPGKAMPTAGSDIKVVAMPEIKTKNGTASPKNLVYAWERNYNNDATGSGYGKNFFTYTNDYLENTDNIAVTASTTDQKYSSQASVDIGTVQPHIAFYKNDPNLGTLWQLALADGHRMTGDEVVIAEPYFISPKEIWGPNLVWNWSINDSSVSILSTRKNLIPLQVQAGVSGESTLKLEIENNDQILETASKEINIEF